ncbi:uncharacterized protein PFL1_06509 [Pseudozyma flocculosa PF-1]|uniref:Uncharacterized protein n=2 Tax=Pseudozyma flocculosa TaxID=84751 RepID=A0A5C3F854_9BASI|nr:uncharacterized protein PFL1_06509 [Pseudozyma flocculosa PF-1]EPQ25834.1 hypothetical protein PFL1_06509 [Pseudozyma flocculosa PF-1]SPO40668.1 uncharacterized protein PSFLO_06150 [Pseudozyma flocculosa]
MAPPTTSFASPQHAVPTVWGMVWLLHTALELPLSVVGLFLTSSVRFEEMNNTVRVMIKLYSALSLSLSLACLLLYTLPDYLPGKRAVAILLLFYHGIASSVFLNADPITGVSLGAQFKLAQHQLTPELLAGVAHGLLALMVTAWWQSTLGQVKAAAGGGVPAGRKGR